MPTIEERAKKEYCRTTMNGVQHYNIGYEHYIAGATEQKQIDDREMSDALFIQRQMFFEKACEQFCHCMGCGMYDKCHSEGDFCDAFSNFKKAMNE